MGHGRGPHERAMRMLLAAAMVAQCIVGHAQDLEESTAVDETVVRLTPAEARSTLEQPLPQGATPQQEIAYLTKRQQAAFTVGDSAVRIAALRRLVELTSGPDRVSPYQGFLWRELWRYGNQTEAMQMGEALAENKALPPGRRASVLGDLGNDYLYVGNPAAAKRTLSRGEAEVQRNAAAMTPFDVAYSGVTLEGLRSNILRHEGDLDAAEIAARKSATMATAMVAQFARRGTVTNPFQSDSSIRLRNSTLSRLVTVSIAQGKSFEAEAVARMGIRLAQEDQTGGAVLGIWYSRLALAKLGQRRYQDAHDSATQAVEALRAAGVEGSAEWMITAQLNQLQALFGLVRWSDADALVASIRAATAQDPVARQRIDSAVLDSFLHLVNGRTDAALQRLTPSINYRIRNFGDTNPQTVEAKAVRAMVYQAMGQTRNALSDYDAVLASIFKPETTFADVEPAGLRSFYVPLALQSYLRLVATSYKEGGARGVSDATASDAFRVADRLRSSVVQQALIDSSARFAAANPEIAELTRREQDERRKTRDAILQLNKQLEEDAKLARAAAEKQKVNPDPQEALAERERARQRGAEIVRTRETVAAGDKARGELVRELAKRFPEYQALVNPKAPTLDQAAELLQRDEALVSIYPTREGTFVWAAGGGRGPSFHFSPLTQSDVKALVARMRATLDIGDQPSPGSKPFDVAAGHQLYTELLAPLWARLGSARRLVFVVNGDLAQVPMAVLVTEPPGGGGAPAWLVRKVAVAQVSTVAAFSALRQAKRRSEPTQAFTGFGDPVFRKDAPPGASVRAVRAVVRAKPGVLRDFTITDADYAEVPPLPETREEVLAIAKALGANAERDTFLGERASRRNALTTDLASRRVVAFATHGLKPGDLPGLSRPALAMSMPREPGESPLLVLDDVLSMKLNADWVVLSACNTASDDGRAEEALSGLARGFFFAGARAVLVTHWAVETRSAQELVTRTFVEFTKDPAQSRAEALRRAQLDLIEGRADPQYAHPFFWAPYALSGDPGR